MNRNYIAVAALLSLGTSALASDFSKLAEPSFARTMLLSGQRQQDILCASAALANAMWKRGIAPAAAEAMAQQVSARLAVEIGDDQEARAVIADRSLSLGPQSYDDAKEAKKRLVVLAEIEAICSAYFNSYRSGGIAAFEAILKPVGTRIELLDLPQCVALAERSGRNNPNSIFDERSLTDIKKMLESGSTKAELAARNAAIGGARATLESTSPKPEVLEARAMSCLAVFSVFAKKTRGEE